jgi:acetoin utilization protein AcuB
VDQVMTKEVITVAADAPLEEAARILADRRIGGLPVVEGQTLVGVITETDLFKTLLQMLGGRRAGLRVAVTVAEGKGVLARLTEAISNAGGDIIGLGINETMDRGEPHWEVVFKVRDVARDALVEALRPVVQEIRDVREV